MTNWRRLFKEASSEVHKQIKPILYTSKAEEIIGRGAGGDQTRRIDAMAEDIVIKAIERNRASCILVSEESGTRAIGENPTDYIVLDPIDGTANAVKGVPFFCTSIAQATGPYLRDVKQGLVLDIVNNKTYYAQKCSGAFRGKTSLTSSTVTSLGEAMISIEMSLPNNPTHLARVTPLLLNTRKIRHLGATALEICFVAQGSLDAFVDLRNITRSVDIAAAYIIIREAGGIISTLNADASEIRLDATQRLSVIAAANLKLYDSILNQVK